MLFNFERKISAWIKANPLKTHLILLKTKNLNWLHYVTLKSNLCKTCMELSVEFNSFEKFKTIASLPILCPYFRYFFFFKKKKKKRFDRKSSKPGHANLVLITSTIQAEPWNLNFNFDDISTNFLQVLTYYGFSRSMTRTIVTRNR